MTKTDADSPNQGQFDRQKHLLFACLGILQAPLSQAVWPALPLIVHTSPWTADLDVLARMIPTCFAAFVAWLAFEIFDTRSGVTILPRRWADIGLPALLAFFVYDAHGVWMRWQMPPEQIERLVANWTTYYTNPAGQLQIGWVIVGGFAVAIAEEIVHRALILRALEGYMNRWLALVVHALIFEAVHVFIYGYGFRGGNWFIAALIFGYAFQRTRSLAVPVLMHASSWVIFYASIHWLAH